MGTSSNISAINDAWIPDAINFRLSSVTFTMTNFKVSNLISSDERKWKSELIVNTFLEEEAGRILRIPLTRGPHDDFMVWSGEPSREFSVQSAYKLLQISNPRAYTLQSIYRDLYKKIWLLNLPTKIKITIWKLSWNCVPHESTCSTGS